MEKVMLGKWEVSGMFWEVSGRLVVCFGRQVGGKCYVLGGKWEVRRESVNSQ